MSGGSEGVTNAVVWLVLPVPLAVASRATLLDRLRYVVSLDIILVYSELL